MNADWRERAHATSNARFRADDGMTQEAADRIGRDIIQNARLVPLEVDLSQQGSASVQFSVLFFDLKLSSASSTKVHRYLNKSASVIKNGFAISYSLFDGARLSPTGRR